MGGLRRISTSFFPLACALLVAGAGVALPEFAAFETVNGVPQLSVPGPDSFHAYWGVWRTLTDAEREALRSSGSGRLFSHRKISWKTVRCDDGAEVGADGEDVWYLDPIVFDDEGRVEPIREALRSDYRYFSLLNLNGMKLAGPQARSLKGLRGEVELDSRLFLFASAQAPSVAGFLSLRGFQGSKDPGHQAFLDKTHPYRWPVYYDERAHKDHSLRAPVDFGEFESRALSQDHFQMRLVWDSCDGATVRVEGRVPGGVIPVGGPNRPMREDRGDSPLPIRVLE